MLGTIAASRTHAVSVAGHSFAVATAGGFRLAFWVLTTAVPAGLAIAARYLRTDGQPS